MATHALRAKTPETTERLHAFANVKDAASFLHPLLGLGDLVLAKGNVNADHRGRLAHHWLEPISCWRTVLGKNQLCRYSSDLPAEGKRGETPAWKGKVVRNKEGAGMRHGRN